jgi:transcriptional regulator with XRE-family HTH domain
VDVEPYDVARDALDESVDGYDVYVGVDDVVRLAYDEDVVPYDVRRRLVRSVFVRADEEACVAVSKGTFRLGELLRLARHAIGSDQEAFAQRVGVSSRTVSRWETASQALTAEQRPTVVSAVAAAPREIVDELAALLGVASPYARAAPVAPATRALPTVAELRALFDAVVFAASEERDVLPRHLRAFGVELLLAVDRAGVSARDAAALVAGRERAPGRNATKGG